MAWSDWEKVGGFEFTDIIYEKKWREAGGGVARITLNRPQRHNAFTAHTMEEFMDCIEDTNHDSQIGVMLITGAGDRAFSSGGDVKWEAGGGLKRSYNRTRVSDDFLRQCKKPVIAVVKGYAIGGGNHMAYMCDFTIAADNAIFGQVAPKIGSPGDGYPLVYLTRIIGAKRAKEFWMLCRQYTAQQALQMGLVNSVVPLAKLDEEVDRWCEELLSKSPTCLQVIKAAFSTDVDLLVGLNQPGRLSSMIAPNYFEGEEIKEAQQAFFEKRPPDFWAAVKRDQEKARKKKS